MFLKIYIPKDSIASYSAMKTHGRNWQKLFIQEETQMTTKPMKRCSAPPVESKMSVETILNYHFTPFHLKMFFFHTVHFITLTHLFWNWKFVSINFPHLFLSPPTLLRSGNYLFVLCLYLWLCFRFVVNVHLFWSLDSTHKWKHMVFVFSVWFISHSFIPFRSIHVVFNGKISLTFFFFLTTEVTSFKICLETQKTQNSQSKCEKEKQNWRNQAPWFNTYTTKL